MKRWLLYLLCLGGILILPRSVQPDVSELIPAELLYIYIEDRLVVKTDAGESGSGWTLEDALLQLRESASGELFLDTVSCLLVTEDTKKYLPELNRYLRPGTGVVLATTDVDPEEAVVFLNAHPPMVRLYECGETGLILPKLMKAEGRYFLVG